MPLSVQVTFIGRLGNNLFQYALGRIIAEHHGLELNCIDTRTSPTRFLGREVDIGPPATLKMLTRHFPGAPLHLKGNRIYSPVQSFEINEQKGWNGYSLNLNAVLQDASLRQIRLAGYFQRYEYFQPFKDRIQKWFRIASVSVPFVSPQDVLINIRRGTDYEVLNWILPTSYYHEALAKMENIGRVYICGTCIDDGIHRSMERYRPVYYNGSPIEHLAFMGRFNRLVLSNSTFAWWGALLSGAAEIYAPKSGDGITFAPTGFQDVDLHLQDSSYREIEVSGSPTVAFPVLDRVRLVCAGQYGDTLEVRYGNNTSGSLRIDPRNEDWINSFIKKGRPITLSEIRQNYCGSDLANFIEQLIKCQILSAETISLD